MSALFFHPSRDGWRPLRWLLGCLAFLLLAGATPAAEVAVKASLSRGLTAVGDAVQYQIKITGTKNVGNPPDVVVDGLSIQYVGPSQNSVMRFQNGNFSAETSVTYVYQVAPDKAGTFTIPSLPVEAEGKVFKTEPVALTAQKSSTPNDDDTPQALGFAELVLPQKTAYVGEVIPVELRLYVDARIRWQISSLPVLSGEGFTKQKIPDPKEPQQITKNGRSYDLLIFKTAITPGKAGKISIGPADIAYTAQVPRARRRGAQPFRDMFGDDVFGDPFFAVTQQFKIKVEPAELAVKPLPAAGKPRDFSGAVGSFDFTAEGSPSQVKVGDPVTMKLRVSGRGNFDRLTAPTLSDSAGWRTYPPAQNFKAEDELGLTGVKTFEMAVIPETKQTQMPAFQFSYFDPTTEKYVTRTSEPAPLQVSGSALPAATPASVASGAAEPPAPAKAGTPALPAVTDILGLRYDAGSGVRSFAPLYEQRDFWRTQAVPFAVLLGLLAWRMRRQVDAGAARVTALRREKEALLTRLRAGTLEPADFYSTAARFVQVVTALSTGLEAAAIDAAEATSAATLAGESAVVIDELFAARAELLYAGSGPGGGAPGPDQARVLAVLESLGRRDAKS